MNIEIKLSELRKVGTADYFSSNPQVQKRLAVRALRSRGTPESHFVADQLSLNNPNLTVQVADDVSSLT